MITSEELTDRERRLVEGFVWLANVHHEVTHQAKITAGMRSFKMCDTDVCRYAAKIVTWSEVVTQVPVDRNEASGVGSDGKT